MARSDFRFVHRKRVRFAEVDAQAVVFFARYLEYTDIALTEYWRALGMIGDGPLTGEGSAEFHVAKATVEYRAPMLLDEEIDIAVRCSRVGRSSMTFDFEFHGRDREDLRATAQSIQVHVAEVRGAPTPVPDRIVALFEAYEGRKLREEKVA